MAFGGNLQKKHLCFILYIEVTVLCTCIYKHLKCSSFAIVLYSYVCTYVATGFSTLFSIIHSRNSLPVIIPKNQPFNLNLCTSYVTF